MFSELSMDDLNENNGVAKFFMDKIFKKDELVRLMKHMPNLIGLKAVK